MPGRRPKPELSSVAGHGLRGSGTKDGMPGDKMPALQPLRALARYETEFLRLFAMLNVFDEFATASLGTNGFGMHMIWEM